MRQRVYVLTTTASAITASALILSLQSLGVDLGYHARIPERAPAADGRLVVPAAAVDRRALMTSGGSLEGRLAAVVLGVALPAPARGPAPEPEASPPTRNRERPVQERARRLRRPGGAVPSVPEPAPVPAPAAPRPVAVPAVNKGGGGDDDEARGGREDGEGGGAAPARSGPEQKRERPGRMLQRALVLDSGAQPPGTHPAHGQVAGRVEVAYGRQSASPALKRHPRWKHEGERSRGHGGGRPAEPRGKTRRGGP